MTSKDLAPPVIVKIGVESLRKIDECFQRQPMLEELVKEQANTIQELKKSLSIAEKERDLEKRENEINQRMLAVREREVASLNNAIDRLNQVTDRAIKLAEVSKPGSNWQLQGLLYLITAATFYVLGSK